MPKYRGGLDIKSNLISVSITEHVMWHFCNYKLWNKIEDKLAYKGLSGKTKEREELLAEMSRNKTWITNGIDSKLHNKLEILPDGWYRGRTVPDGFGEAISRATKGRKQTEEWIRKRTETASVTKRKWIKVTNPDGVCYDYQGITEFCKEMGWATHGNGIRKVLKGKWKHYKGYNFEYLDILNDTSIC